MAIVDDLAAAMRDGRDRESVAWSLAALSAYSGYHFGFEEQLMAANGYPGAHERSLRQRVFVRTLNEFRLAHASGQQDLTPALVEFLTTWLVHHTTSAEQRDVARLADQQVA
jgi:hemerythrin-like metal-binding protein